MGATQNADEIVTEILAGAEVRVCGRCGKLSSVPFADADDRLWFCFECGHEEPRDE